MNPSRQAAADTMPAAALRVRALNRHVDPQRNGWTFWTVTATGNLLQSVRRPTSGLSA
ncbi:hypothetical protein [Streptomyces sp. SP2-10]|uniref:hypothetical protein n=1 Tax=Streptomyces sp. SP2-10 TaxID=2873385 RepID=UPI001CA67D41|nr:hypothetical protein [Streptomyces sp. SP2-10]MBY8845835.1 hypothetical protein [Streptomyces sp. SP2-10]